jgi:peptidoglycan/LPS O-acetylase OafA/YrhL
MPSTALPTRDQPGKEIHPFSSFGRRFVPPALIGLAWWLSGIELIEACDKAKDWKILGIAFPVFWLAASGARLVSLRPRQATWVAAGLALLGVICGAFVSVAPYFLGHVLYGATHASFIAAFGLLTFLAMTRSDEPRDQSRLQQG